MKQLTWVLGTCVALVLLTSGCLSSYLPARLQIASQDDPTIDRWVADKQYGRAIKALEDREKRKPSARARHKLQEVHTAAANHEKEIIKKAQTKMKAGRWQSAFVVIDEALQQYPESNKLHRYRESISRKQTGSIKRSNLQLVAAKAMYLSRIRPIFHELNKLDPDDADIQWKLKATDLEIVETAKSLSASGANAIKQLDLETAQRYLELADQLNPTPENTQALADLAHLRVTRLAQQPKLSSPPPDKAQEARLNKLIRSVRGALRRGDLESSAGLLNQAQGIAPEDSEVVKLRLALESSTHQRVAQLVHRGNELYSKGRIDQARVSWKKALTFDPNNPQIQSSVDRAERVLSTLRKIQNHNDQKPVPPPVVF